MQNEKRFLAGPAWPQLPSSGKMVVVNTNDSYCNTGCTDTLDASYSAQGKVQNLWLLVSSCLVCSWQQWPRIEGQWACFLFGLMTEFLVLRGKSNAQNFNC